jgi:hypothetical protein
VWLTHCSPFFFEDSRNVIHKCTLCHSQITSKDRKEVNLLFKIKGKKEKEKEKQLIALLQLDRKQIFQFQNTNKKRKFQ